MVQIFPTLHPSPAPSLYNFREGIKGPIVSAAHMLMALYGDEARNISITRKAPHTLGPCFPDFIQVARSQQGWGVGVDTRWGLICPGALGAPHTMHYGWEGLRKGLVAPSRSLCTREKAVEYLGSP